jgi:hypothetical protein
LGGSHWEVGCRPVGIAFAAPALHLRSGRLRSLPRAAGTGRPAVRISNRWAGPGGPGEVTSAMKLLPDRPRCLNHLCGFAASRQARCTRPGPGKEAGRPGLATSLSPALQAPRTDGPRRCALYLLGASAAPAASSSTTVRGLGRCGRSGKLLVAASASWGLGRHRPLGSCTRPAGSCVPPAGRRSRRQTRTADRRRSDQG